MKTLYVIEDITASIFWAESYGTFLDWIHVTKFSSEEQLLKYAQERNIGVFKITKVYDTK